MTVPEQPATDPGLLLKFMKDVQSPQSLWTRDEMAAMLRHQMNSPLEADIELLDPEVAAQVRTLAAGATPPIASLWDLLNHPHPPLELLQTIKEMAKINPHHPEHCIPKEIATVVYFAAIVVAQRRLGRKISNLNDAVITEGVNWVLAQPWLSTEIRGVFTADSGGKESA